MINPLLTVLGFSAMIGAAHAVTFIPIQSVTTNTTNDLWPIERLIQGPGSGFDANEPHDILGSGGPAYNWVTNNPYGSGDYYGPNQPDPVLVFDLGGDRLLTEISTWGYSTGNTNGAKDFSLLFATSLDGSGGFGTSITYNPSFVAAFDPLTRDSHAFGQSVSARYVQMTITDNYGFMEMGAGGDRVGLGEVAFVPDGGSSVALLGLSLLGVGALRRKTP